MLPSQLIKHHHQHNKIKLKHKDTPYATNLACKELSHIKSQLHTTSCSSLTTFSHQQKRENSTFEHDYKICKLTQNVENAKM